MIHNGIPFNSIESGGSGNNIVRHIPEPPILILSSNKKKQRSLSLLNKFKVNHEEANLLTTIEEILSSHEGRKEPVGIDITAGYFTAGGWWEIKEALTKMLDEHEETHIRILIGKEDIGSPDRTNSEDTYAISAEEVIQDTRETVTLPSLFKAVELVEWFLNHNDRVELRVYTEKFLHSKTWNIYNKRSDKGGILIAGSGNFTVNGLKRNLEAFIVLNDSYTDDSKEIEKARSWFQELWESSRESEFQIQNDNEILIRTYQELTENQDPEITFLIALQDAFRDSNLKDEIEWLEGFEDNWLEGLYDFQVDGAKEALARLNKHNGCIIADEVGLGKTYIAGAIAKFFIQNLDERVLILSPASLLPTWNEYLDSWEDDDIRRKIKTVRKDETLRTLKMRADHLTEAGEALTADKFSVDLRNIKLIIIDEAHFLRNHSTMGYEKLTDILIGVINPGAKILLLTATPINNKPSDIYNLIKIFMPDSELYATTGIQNLKKEFDKLYGENSGAVANGTNAWVYILLNQVLIKRTKEYVLQNSDDVKAVFPKLVIPPKVKYKWGDEYKKIGEEILIAAENAIDNSSEESTFSLAIYRWRDYVLDVDEALKRKPTPFVLLYRSILSSLSSSPTTLINTLEKQRDNIRKRIKDLRNHGVVTHSLAYDIAETDDKEEDEDSLATTRKETAKKYYFKDEKSKDEYLNLLTIDKNTINGWLETLRPIESEEKLDKLVEEILIPASQRTCDDKECLEGCQQCLNRKKVIIFANYLASISYLEERLQKHDKLPHIYKDNIVSVTGQTKNKSSIAKSFAPSSASKSAHHEEPKKQNHLLIATDTLAEGVNLQDSSIVIHWDLPYNPMKIVQRAGRVCRIGSSHRKAESYIMLPDEDIYLQALRVLEILQVKMMTAKNLLGEKDVINPTSEQTHDENPYEIIEDYIQNSNKTGQDEQELKIKMNQLGIFTEEIDRMLHENRKIGWERKLIESDGEIEAKKITEATETIDYSSLLKIYPTLHPKIKKTLLNPIERKGTFALSTDGTEGWLIHYRITDQKDPSRTQTATVWFNTANPDSEPEILGKALESSSPFLSWNPEEPEKTEMRFTKEQTWRMTQQFNLELQERYNEAIQINKPHEINSYANNNQIQRLNSIYKKHQIEDKNKYKSLNHILNNFLLLTPGVQNSFREELKKLINIEDTLTTLPRLGALNSHAKRAIKKITSNNIITSPEYELITWMRVISRN